MANRSARSTWIVTRSAATQFDKTRDRDVEDEAYGIGRGHHVQSSSQHSEKEPSLQAAVSDGGGGSHGHHRVSSSGQGMESRRAETSTTACEYYHPLDFLEPQDVAALAAAGCHTSAAAGWILECLDGSLGTANSGRQREGAATSVLAKLSLSTCSADTTWAVSAEIDEVTHILRRPLLPHRGIF
mmetsp:Transcript_51787/g.168327  ORF Transcript_51787/g.168327 Transcript_51787/m.168327 type:complete len:185 (+) Transcript_51787:694-1248(+)